MFGNFIHALLAWGSSAFMSPGPSLTMSCGAEDDPKDWPGPKAWPATLALISFFAVNVFGQVLAIPQ